MSEQALVVRDGNVGAITFRQATDVAGMCKAIVTETAVRIQNRRYVRVEGWQAIAVAHGCVASARDVERIQGGVRAIGEVKRGTDGMVLATAEGFVGDDEATWGKREEYAKRAMAQTRAISRACRSAFAHVVVLMNAGLETTPAEEVPEGGFRDTPPPSAPKGQPPPAVKQGWLAVCEKNDALKSAMKAAKMKGTDCDRLWSRVRPQDSVPTEVQFEALVSEFIAAKTEAERKA